MTIPRKSYFHRGSEHPITGDTIPERILDIAGRFPENEAIVSLHQNRRLTYRELIANSDRIALSLLNMGFRKGDRIGVWSTNNIEWILLQVATAKVGMVLVNINPAYRSTELSYALKKSRIQSLFIIPRFRKSDYIEILRETMPDIDSVGAFGFSHCASAYFPDLRKIIIFDPENPMNTVSPYEKILPWGDFIALSVNTVGARSTKQSGQGQDDSFHESDLYKRMEELDPDDPINIQYTSGTTGFPKAVVLSHMNILNNAIFTGQIMEFTHKDRLCVPVPFYHCFGMVLSSLLCLSTGATMVIPAEHFDPLKTLEAIHNEKCTALHGVPTMFIAQLEQPRFHEFDLSSLRTGIMAGAPCPPELLRRVMEEMHCKNILVGYGQTEASPLTHLTSPSDSFEQRVETVGTNLPHQEVKIIDIVSGKTVPMGQTGEVCFRGYHIMKEYYDDTDATSSAIDSNGWLHSGDLGSMDENGYVRITGRLKDMIIRGGENISPREIEDFLFTHPAVSAAAVFGIPHDYYGEEVIAWVMLHEGAIVSEDSLKDFCRGKIAHYKIPSKIRFVEDFPMTVTGKIQKFRMREIESMKNQGQ